MKSNIFHAIISITYFQTLSMFDGNFEKLSKNDAKSIMGIFSLDLLSPIKLTVHSDNADELISKISGFIVD